MAEDNYPFGISPSFIDEWDKTHGVAGVHNSPVRANAEDTDVWDFLLGDSPGEEAFLAGVVDALKEVAP
jgi:hypothetical protein